MKRLLIAIICFAMLSSVAFAAAPGVLSISATVTTDFDGIVSAYLEGEQGVVSAELTADNGYNQEFELAPGTYNYAYISAVDMEGSSYKISVPGSVEVFEDGITEYNIQLLGLESIVGPTQKPSNPTITPPESENPENPSEVVPEELVPEAPSIWKQIFSLDNIITLVIILILAGILVYTKVRSTMYKDID